MANDFSAMDVYAEALAGNGSRLRAPGRACVTRECGRARVWMAVGKIDSLLL